MSFRRRSCPHWNSLPSKNWQQRAWATRRSRPRWACRSRQRNGGCRSSARTARQRWATRRRGGWFVSYPCICRLTSLELRVTCAFFSGAHDKIQERARAKILINAWAATVPCCSVASVRKRPQASGTERGGSSVRVHESGALASEASDMWRVVAFPLCILISWPSHKNQHLTAPNKRRRLEWCTSMLERFGEGKRRHSVWCSCKTHISRGFHSVARHSQVSTTLLPRSVSLDFSWNELETQLVQQFLPIAGTSDPRVSRDVGKQPLYVRKDGLSFHPKKKPEMGLLTRKKSASHKLWRR